MTIALTRARTALYQPRLWLAVTFALMAIATTRCGDAYR